MRALSIVLAIVLVAAVALGAVVLLATGKGFVYSPGIGSTRSMGKGLSWWAITALVGIGIAGVFHILARKLPKKYFQAIWWRDLALVISLFAATAVVLTEVARVLMYGA